MCDCALILPSLTHSNRDGDGCINEEDFLQIMKGSGSF